jgi:hypothetical protein
MKRRIASAIPEPGLGLAHPFLGPAGVEILPIEDELSRHWNQERK